MNKTVFLDRDGVICKEKNLFNKGYPITKPEHFEWILNSQKAFTVLSKLEEFLLVVVTNQSIINKGILTIDDFHKINQPIYDELKKYGKTLDGFYFCPHMPEENCDCRKPKIGMLLQAKKDLDIDFKNSYVIGDKTVDIKMGKNAGCKTILVQTGYAGKDNLFSVEPTFIVKDLLGALYIIK